MMYRYMTRSVIYLKVGGLIPAQSNSGATVPDYTHSLCFYVIHQQFPSLLNVCVVSGKNLIYFETLWERVRIQC